MTLRERIREHRRRAVEAACQSKAIDGAFERARRQDWALSRERSGWSKPLVDDAIGAGSLSAVRAAIVDPPKDLDERPRLVKAMRALGTIDSGRRLEPSAPHYGDDIPPLQRRTYATARLRAV